MGIVVAYVVVDRCDNDRANHQQPVGHGDVRLFVEVFAGMNDLDMRKVAKSHHLH